MSGWKDRGKIPLGLRQSKKDSLLYSVPLPMNSRLLKLLCIHHHYCTHTNDIINDYTPLLTILFLLQYIVLRTQATMYTYSKKITAYITKKMLGLCKIKLQVQLQTSRPHVTWGKYLSKYCLEPEKNNRSINRPIQVEKSVNTSEHRIEFCILCSLVNTGKRNVAYTICLEYLWVGTQIVRN